MRQALNYALDVPAIIKNVLGGRAYQVATPLAPGVFGFDEKIFPYPHDLAKAKKLLAKAGYPDGKGLEMVLNAPVGRYDKDKEIAEAIAGQLSATGAKITLRIQEWAVHTIQVSKRALTPMYELGWGNESYDADNPLTALLTSDARIATWGTPETDKLITDAASNLTRSSGRCCIARHLGSYGKRRRGCSSSGSRTSTRPPNGCSGSRAATKASSLIR